MTSHPGWRPAFTRWGTRLCIAIGVLWALSTVHSMGWDGGKRDIYIESGRLVYSHLTLSPPRGLFVRARAPSVRNDWRFSFATFPQGLGSFIAIPLWAIVLPVLVATSYVRWLDRHRPAPPRCDQCGSTEMCKACGCCTRCGAAVPPGGTTPQNHIGVPT